MCIVRRSPNFNSFLSVFPADAGDSLLLTVLSEAFSSTDSYESVRIYLRVRGGNWCSSLWISSSSPSDQSTFESDSVLLSTSAVLSLTKRFPLPGLSPRRFRGLVAATDVLSRDRWVSGGVASEAAASESFKFERERPFIRKLFFRHLYGSLWRGRDG